MTEKIIKSQLSYATFFSKKKKTVTFYTISIKVQRLIAFVKSKH